MNDIQKVVFDMFEHFVRVCKILDLSFFVINGSALGAEKYGGFIPWDDDMDIGMPRDDYEIFLSEAQKLMPEEIFVQNYRTDKNFPFMYTKLRNSNTTFVETSVRKIDMNHGIYLDIFPLDGCDDDYEKSKYKAFKIKVLHWLHFCALDDRSSLKIRIRNSIFRFLGFHRRTAKYLRMLDGIFSNTDKNTKYLCNFNDRQGKGRVLRDWYGNGSMAMFEGIDVRIPEKFDDYLTEKYGDWRSDLPEDKQKSHHKALISDVTKPFTEYTVNIKC